MIQITKEYLRPRLLVRENDSHKGDYGHLLVVAGCETMPGAAVLSTGAALKSGCGLVTLHSTPRALQAAVNLFPSAMLSQDPGRCFSALPAAGLSRYGAIAVGPGLGRDPGTGEALRSLLASARDEGVPMVLDADALNWIAACPDAWELISPGSVLTPHRGELRRLLGGTDAPEEEAIRALCGRTGCVLVRKGFRTCVFMPSGETLVNSTGNPGLAKGGSGDVLTGLVGGLLARGYRAPDAAALGVWLHGFAGDVLSERCTPEAYNSLDLIDVLWEGFVRLYAR